MIKRVLGLGGVWLALGALGEARADPTSCTLPPGAYMFVLRYFGLAQGNAGSPLCSVSGNLMGCSLSGWFYQPKLSGKFPTIVLNHSSDEPRVEADYCPIVEHYVALGYAVFEPVRRGYSGDRGIGVNSGELPATTLALMDVGQPARSPLVPWLTSVCALDNVAGLSPTEHDCVNTALQWNQVQEISMAVDMLRGLAVVDGSRLALVGHGSGANISLMSASRDAIPNLPSGVRAGVLLSPGESSWPDSPILRDLLIASVERRRFPVAILQPQNGDSVEPTMQLAQRAVTTGGFQFQASLLPEVVQDGVVLGPALIRKRFATRAKHVGQWAPIAMRFMNIYGVK